MSLRLFRWFIVAAALAGCGQQPASTWPAYLRQDLYPKWVTIVWPPNDGCSAEPVAEVLPAGTLIDRFGGETGKFFSPRGESFKARAVPYVCAQMAYTAYRVTKPLAVKSCKAAPWFGEPGGAVQYQTVDPASKLRESGTIEPTTNAGAVSPCESP